MAHDADERARLLAAAEGNPFFLEQMVAMRQETGSPASTPATIQAVLAARIDALTHVERAVLDCAAIEGRQFHRGIVAELLAAPDRGSLEQALGSLVQRDLIRPERPDLPGEEGYRFSHILIREAVYTLLPKAQRADLHERFARLLEARAVGDRDLGEIIGYHFEQAYQCSTDLQPVQGSDHRRLAHAGARHLGAVGHVALGRGDVPAAVNLLQRAAKLFDDDQTELGWLLPELGSALTQRATCPRPSACWPRRSVEHPSAGSRSTRPTRSSACSSPVCASRSGPAAHEVRRRFADLVATFNASGDDLGLDRAWRLRALVYWLEARSGDAGGGLGGRRRARPPGR